MTLTTNPLPKDVAGDEEFDPFAGPALLESVPSTEPQREVWTAARMREDATCSFNLLLSVVLRGPLDRAALQVALSRFIERHDALRGTFSGDGSVLCVASPSPVELPFLDLASIADAERGAVLLQMQREDVILPFDLVRGPLYRARLVQISATEHQLLFSAHHIVFDGWSAGIMLEELMELYGATVEGRAHRLEEPPSFARYARDQGSLADEVADDEGYWLSTLTGDLPILELPTDLPRPVMRSYRSAREDYEIDGDLVAGLKAFGAARRASLLVVLFTAYTNFVSRLAGQEELVVGLPVAGQPSAGVGGLVGHCVHLLPMRISRAPGESFESSIVTSRAAVLEGCEHFRVTYGSLLRRLPVERDPARPSLVSTVFNLDQTSAITAAGVEATIHTFPRAFDNFELFVNALLVDGRLIVECQYSLDLFTAETIRRWLAAFESFLRTALQNPTVPLETLDLCTGEERGLVLDTFNRNEVVEPPHVRVEQIVEEQAARTPDATALRCGTESLTYRELVARASAVGDWLGEQGVTPGSVVALSAGRSLELVVGLLGIWKAGAAYVFLEPAFPAERVRHVVADSHAALLLVDAQGERIARAVEVPVARIADAPRDGGGARPSPGTAEGVAYLIYTSGSTGRPKGVAVPHRCVSSFISAGLVRPGVRSEDILLAVASFGFDFSIFELFLPLAVGGTVVIATADAIADGNQLQRVLAQESVTMLASTPSLFRFLLDSGWQGRSGFRSIVGGEAIPRDLIRRLLSFSSEVWNVYGPTETTVLSHAGRLVDADAPITVGRSLPNVAGYVLDPHGRPSMVGVPGEVYLAGNGVSLGYPARADLTKERFPPDPFVPGRVMYRTGDLGKFHPDGSLEILGRADTQLKIRGFRVEAGEVESVLDLLEGVRESVVAVAKDERGDQRLVAWIVVEEGVDFTATEVRRHLRTYLPEYMIPQHVCTVAALPCTLNGKVDRQALVRSFSVVGDAEAFVPPRTEREKLVAAAWEEQLGVRAVGLHDNFFRMGGHSLLAMRVIWHLERATGVRLPAQALLTESLEQIAVRLG